MADELKIRLAFEYSKDGTVLSRNFGQQSYDVSGDSPTYGRVSVGTSEEAIPLGDSGVGGWMVVHNHDATNFVRIRPASSEKDVVQVNAGEAQAFRLNSAEPAPYWIADTAACDVEYWLFPA